MTALALQIYQRDGARRHALVYNGRRPLAFIVREKRAVYTPVVSVPSLDEVRRNPACLNGLSLTVLVDLQRHARYVLADLSAAVALAMTSSPNTRDTAPPHRVVRIREAASLLGMSVDFLYRHWKTLGGFKDSDNHIKFSASTLGTRVSGVR